MSADVTKRGLLRVRITREREYEIDLDRLYEVFGAEIATDVDSGLHPDEHSSIRESFFELCGWDNDEDHTREGIVALSGEYSDTDWEWPNGDIE